MDYVGGVGLLISGLAIVAGVWVYWRQMNAQLFLEFNKRHEEIANSADLHDATRARSWALRYLNLCSEEYHLRKSRYLSKSIWRIWEKEIRRMIASPQMVEMWPTIKGEFASFPSFARWVAEIQRAGQRDYIV